MYMFVVFPLVCDSRLCGPASQAKLHHLVKDLIVGLTLTGPLQVFEKKRFCKVQNCSSCVTERYKT